MPTEARQRNGGGVMKGAPAKAGLDGDFYRGLLFACALMIPFWTIVAIIFWRTR